MADSREESPPVIRFRVKLAALAIGLCAAAIFLVALEGAFWAFNKHRDANFSGEQPYLFEFSQTLGYKPLANADARATKYHGNQFLYDVVYHTDEFGRRRTPEPIASPDHFIAFFGCSYTFGEGVAESETLPAHANGEVT
jgi:hypothetical protein